MIRQGDLLFKEKKKCIFLDAGTGTGCVGITIANERPEWKVLLLELYSKAIEVAQINLKLCKNNNINLICSDWLKPIAKKSFDFIFSNPPYIRINDESIDEFVKYNEPSTSLFSKKNGLEDINKIIKYSREALSTNGILFLENGVGQSKDISDYLELNDLLVQSSNNKYELHIKNTLHLDYTDIPLMSPLIEYIMDVGSLPASTTLPLINDIVYHFLQENLLKKESSKLDSLINNQLIVQL